MSISNQPATGEPAATGDDSTPSSTPDGTQPSHRTAQGHGGAMVRLSARDAAFAVEHLRFLVDRETATTGDHAAANLTARWLADQIDQSRTRSGVDASSGRRDVADAVRQAAAMVLHDAIDGEMLIGAGRGFDNHSEDVALSTARPGEVVWWAVNALAEAGLLVSPAQACAHDWMQRGAGPEDRWRECFLCGLIADLPRRSQPDENGGT